MSAGGIEDVSHSGIIMWVVGILITIGGIMLGVVKSMISGVKTAVKEGIKEKVDKEFCTLQHTALTEKIDDIKEQVSKIGDIQNSITRIETILNGKIK